MNSKNHRESNNKRPVDILTNKVLGNLNKDYFVIGRERITGWPAWLIIGIMVGVTIGISR